MTGTSPYMMQIAQIMAEKWAMQTVSANVEEECHCPALKQKLKLIIFAYIINF